MRIVVGPFSLDALIIDDEPVLITDPAKNEVYIPVLELSGPLDRRLDAVLAALDQARR